MPNLQPPLDEYIKLFLFIITVKAVVLKIEILNNMNRKLFRANANFHVDEVGSYLYSKNNDDAQHHRARSLHHPPVSLDLSKNITLYTKLYVTIVICYQNLQVDSPFKRWHSRHSIAPRYNTSSYLQILGQDSM